jgi:hypothetical protein
VAYSKSERPKELSRGAAAAGGWEVVKRGGKVVKAGELLCIPGFIKPFFCEQRGCWGEVPRLFKERAIYLE